MAASLGGMERSKEATPAPPLPPLDDGGEGERRQCPDCGHELGQLYRNPWVALGRWLRQYLGRPTKVPRPPGCEWRVEYEADACGCDHSFHSA